MSIVVDPQALADTLTRFDHAYLLTCSEAGDVKVNTVDPVLEGADIVVPFGGVQARLNIAHHDAITLVWPPRTRHGYSLIVDGVASASETEIRLRPTRAILHRPAAHADGEVWTDADGCAQDCHSV